MVATHEIDPESIPVEFMETYTRLNTEYKNDLFSIRDFCFHEYVEPVIVEEEAIAQIQHWLALNPWIYKKEFRSINFQKKLNKFLKNSKKKSTKFLKNSKKFKKMFKND